MKKRAITLTLALLMCLSCALPASASGGSRFTDVPDNAWYAEAVNAMADGGVLNGKGNGKFDPDAPVTLAELSAIICRLKGQMVVEVGGHWAGSAMKETGLGSNSLMHGDEEYDFAYANDPAYRADALSLMVECVIEYNSNIREYGVPPAFETWRIPDHDEYFDACTAEGMYGLPIYIKDGHYYEAFNIDSAYHLGFTHGVDENFTCNAFGTLTRAQLAQMCYNRGWISTGSMLTVG